MAVDTNFSNVALLLHCEGADASTTFTDSSASPKTVTPAGNAQIDTAQFKWGASSALFDGSGDYLDVAGITGGLGNGDFTIELWIRTSTVAGTYATVYHLGSGSPALYRNGSTFVWYDAGAGGDKCVSGTISANTWYHLAVVRSSGTVSLYVDGTASATNYSTSANYTVTTHRIGCNTSATEPFSGWMDDIRITKGIARYTSNFTAPTEAFPDVGPSSETIWTSKMSNPHNDINSYVLPINFLYF